MANKNSRTSCSAMRVYIEEPQRIIHQRTTYQLVVNVDGDKVTIRKSEDDNGTESWICSEKHTAGDFVSDADLEDKTIKELVEKILGLIPDETLFGKEKLQIDL